MTTQEIITKANEMIANGSKTSFEGLIKMLTKNEARKRPTAMTSKDVVKMDTRNRVEADKGPAIDMSDYYREESKKQLGSSMRY